MLGKMMTMPLSISSILRHAAAYHGDTEIVSRTAEGPLHRYTYADAWRRSQQLANALRALKLNTGDRVATLAWNGYRHFEIYYASSGSGMVCHTINPRLFAEQIAYIVNHAADRVLFVDLTFIPLLEAIADRITGIEKIIVMTDAAHMPKSSKLQDLKCYEDLLAAQPDTFDWPDFDENTASSLCYTSGTTADPKGVIYTHRSNVIHALAICAPDAFDLSAATAALPIVPMFHANAWGLAYALPMVGAKIVFPGAQLDGASVHALMQQEGVTFSAGVPTVWLGLLNWMDANNVSFDPRLKMIVVGGAAPPASMIQRFESVGIKVRHAWGMTETSPLGVSCAPKAKHESWPAEKLLALKTKQGRPVYGLEARVVDDKGQALARDGEQFGNLLVRGPWVASGYYRADNDPAFADPGWFSTGDVVTMDEDGFVQIVDRTKDVIKSGGEWISSIALENIAQAHPAVYEAAVVGRRDTKWGERPVLVVVLKKDAHFTKEDMVAHFTGKVASWCIPDAVVCIDELPHTATGKLLKRQIRDMVARPTP